MDAAPNGNPPPPTKDALRGDAVGGTLYSERFVLRLLIDLTKIIRDEQEFSKELENRLCTLWDMAMEEDVVLLLNKHDTILLAINTILKTDNPRIHEILMGIIGNMCFLKSARVASGKNYALVKLILNMLTHDDAGTLIQVVRVLHALACEISSIKQMTDVRQLDVQILPKKDDNGVPPSAASHCTAETPNQANSDGKSSCDQSSHPGTSVDGKQNETNTEIVGSGGEEVLRDLDIWLEVLPNVIFILFSTRNVELIMTLWSFLRTILYIPVENVYMSYFILSENLLTAMLESVREFYKASIIDVEVEVEQKYKTAIDAWITVIYSYTLPTNEPEVISKYRVPLRIVIGVILRAFPNFHPCDEKFESCLSVTLDILQVLMKSDVRETADIISCIEYVANVKVYLAGQMKKKLKFNEDIAYEETSIATIQQYMHKALRYYCSKDGFENTVDTLRQCLKIKA